MEIVMIHRASINSFVDKNFSFCETIKENVTQTDISTRTH
jgi:hypothetical protein